MKEDYEATIRQDAVYTFLLGKPVDKWTSMETVTTTLSMYPSFRNGTYHNSRARRILTRDIKAINNSARYEKTIISSSRGIKIANDEEFEKFIDAELKETLTKLKSIYHTARKGGLDGQYEIDGHAIDAFLSEDTRLDG